MSAGIEVRHLTVPRQARYAVAGDAAAASELWFGLHGYGQTAPGFLRTLSPDADDERLVVAPEGLHRYYLDHDERKVGASWMTSEDRLVDIADYVGWLDRLDAHVRGGLGREPERTVALGFSQGVHTLARWLAFGEADLDLAVLWGSHVPPDLDLEAHAGSLRRARLVIVTGREDPHFGPDAARAQRERLAGYGVPAEVVTFDGGHRLDAGVLGRLRE